MVRTWIGNSGSSSRSKARRNAWSLIRATHRGQRSPDRTKQAGYMTAPDLSADAAKTPCATRAVHT
jgi:hypothetical protein